MKMKDDESKRVSTSDEDKMNRQNGGVVAAMDDVASGSHAAAAVNANGKSRSKPSRKRLSTSSPEEDIIDGFAISSFTSLEALEVGETQFFMAFFIELLGVTALSIHGTLRCKHWQIHQVVR